LLALVFVAISLVSVLAGIYLAYRSKIPVATLSSITSLVSGMVSALLYRRLAMAQKAVETARREVLKQLQVRGGKLPGASKPINASAPVLRK
jgi:hypothetical protein